MSEIDLSNYNIMYAQRLDILLQEQIRKTIDVEVRLSLVNDNLQEYVGKYNESQKQVEIQNEIMQQAATSIETLTIENKNYKSQNEEMIKRISGLENKMNFTDEEKTNIQTSNGQKDNKIKELEREIARQKQELQTTYNDYMLLKEHFPDFDPKNPINKNKKPVEEGTF